MRISDWSSDVCSSDLCRPSADADLGHGEKYDDASEIDDHWRRDQQKPPMQMQLAFAVLRAAAGQRLALVATQMRQVIIEAFDRQEEADHDQQFDHQPGRRAVPAADPVQQRRSEEHTSELQSLMRISYAAYC